MLYSERLQILTEAEQADLYFPPKFSIEEQRLYFNLNDIEIANAIVYFNSMVLSHLLTHYEEIEDEEKIEIIKQVSPVAWENINLNGTYNFASTGKLLDMQELTKPIVEDE